MLAVAWIERLIAAGTVLGGFSAPDQTPAVIELPQAEIARRVCGGPCPVRGAFVPGNGVLIDKSLDIDGSPSDRSILLHEIVHYLQHLAGRFADEPTCERFLDREMEAYHIQDEYLSRYGLSVGPCSIGCNGCRPGVAPPNAWPPRHRAASRLEPRDLGRRERGGGRSRPTFFVLAKTAPSLSRPYAY
jgi:hypothetical protein